MSRESTNIEVNGVVKNGFDYNLQVWVEDYIIQECGHPESMGSDCCNQRIYKGKDIRFVGLQAFLKSNR